jgi:hypothetical protein
VVHGLEAIKQLTIKKRRDILEFDPLGFKPHEPGAKLDAGKPSVWRGLFDYFPRACLAVATVSTLGAKKYSWKGWESVPDGVNRYGDALARHMLKEGMGEIWDPETGELHATHAAWNAFARLELMLRQQEEKGK